jgi:probable phosphoglycerate mutase
MTTIYLVRHGITEWTGHRIIGNIPGVHLNEFGLSQAEYVANYLCQFPLQAIFSSPMERATETARPLAILLRISVKTIDFLREVNFGELQGLGEELASLDVWQQFLTHPATVHFPKGESVADAQQRIVAGLDALAVQYGPNAQIACFAHCEILRLAVAFALHMPLDDFMRLTIQPASISCLEWSESNQSLKLLNFSPEK